MTNEAVLIYETAKPIPFTVADGTGIEKGAILKMTDPMTAVLADGDGDIIAGIAAEEKIANDGKTKLGVYREGIFRVLAGTAVTIGTPVDTHASTGATNEVAAAPVNGEQILGFSLETAADTDTFLIELKPMQVNLA